MNRPNFFIVGAPKCGTTALYHTLRQHPEVFLPYSSDPERYWIYKEPFHFSSDLGIASWLRVEDEADYLDLYAGANGASRLGEASAQYLFSSEAPGRIREFGGGDTRIIIMLRPPVDWMRSWHHDCLGFGHESIVDFGRALDAEPDRAQGRRVPEHSGFKGCLCYRSAAQFSRSVERYFETFGRERVRVFLMEDFAAAPGEVLREVFDFLGVDPAFEPEIKRHNDSCVLPATHLFDFRVGRFIQTTPVLRNLAGLVPGALKEGYRKTVLRLLPPLSDKTIEPGLRARLVEEFGGEVEKLGALIGRDLSHWNKAPAETTRAA